MLNSVEKPKNRSKLRLFLGKEYFILKRRISWFFRYDLAKKKSKTKLPIIVKEHQSFLLRPLKNVDMYLQHNKTTNLELATNKINGIIIKPGESFSLWKLVGRPSRLKGYKDGLVLSNGQIGKGCGGGLCQLGNLIYWMTLHTPLTITERWRHSYDVFPDINRKIPFGSGATLSYNYIGLEIKNETKQVFQINTWVGETHLKGSICSEKELNEKFKVVEKNHHFESQWWGGYTRHNEIWKEKTNKNTGEITEELATQNHAIMMYNPLLEYKDPEVIKIKKPE